MPPEHAASLPGTCTNWYLTRRLTVWLMVIGRRDMAACIYFFHIIVWGQVLRGAQSQPRPDRHISSVAVRLLQKHASSRAPHGHAAAATGLWLMQHA